jgi:hypothetical protein
MSFENIDPSIQRDMTGHGIDAKRLLGAVPPELVPAETTSIAAPVENNPLKDLASKKLELAKWLFDIAEYPLRIPNINDPEFAKNDWTKTSESYQAMTDFGFEPEVVVAPSRFDFFFWKNTFSKLRLWQHDNQSQAVFKLDKSLQGDGLRVSPNAGRNSSEFCSGEPRFPEWSVSVIAGVVNPIDSVNIYGVDENHDLDPELTALADHFGARPFILLPTYNQYLMMVASRLLTSEKPPIDAGTNEVVWLDGIIEAPKRDSRKHFAPTAKWKGHVLSIDLERITHFNSIRPAIQGYNPNLTGNTTTP